MRTVLLLVAAPCAALVLAGCEAGEATSRTDDPDQNVVGRGLSDSSWLDWSRFPDHQQCLAAAQLFFPAQFGVRLPTARAAWTGSCAPQGACHLWLDDVPSPSVFERVPEGSGRRPGPYDLMVYPPGGSNPYGHVAVVDHVDGQGNVFVMDANFNGDERKAQWVHTVPGRAYGWYHLRALPSSSTRALDFDGDGCEDLWAQVGDGLRLYPGNCAGGFRESPAAIGSGWSNFDLVLPTRDDSGDGCPDLFARRPDGTLVFSRGDCAGGLGDVTTAGTGFQALSLLAAPGDLDGDGCGDLVGRDTKGDLLFYPGTCAGSLGDARVIGTGWNGIDALLGGDLDRDGCVDLVGRNAASGELLWYRNDCHAGLAEAERAGTSWSGFDTLVGRDWNGDGCGDVLARAGDGTLTLYRGNCQGSFEEGTLAGTGFHSVSSVE